MIHASVFSGIGGPEVAAAMLGWQNAFHCEINPFGRAVLEYWFPESKSYEDITKTDFREWRGRIDVLTGGFPCQPFSYAGKRGGADDDRYLWPEMLRVVDEVRPTWVVGENVAGVTTMVEEGILTDMGREEALFNEDNGLHGYSLRESFTIEKICKDLENIGYTVQPMLIPAAAVGAPHRRDRVFILAYDASDRGDARLEGKREGDAAPDPAESSSNTYCRGSGEVSAEVFSRDSNGDIFVGHGRERVTADPDGEGLQESVKSGGNQNTEEARAELDDRDQRPGSDGTSADAFCARLAADVQRRCYGEEERDGTQRSALRSSHDAWVKATWWDNFPTVSPVHRGNDGIPFRMDDLTLPSEMQPRSFRKSNSQLFQFGRWRVESIKAYGNAIVPQVMFRIFQAIEQTQESQI